MKKLIFVSLSIFIFFCNAEGQIGMNSSGNVGIGYTPSGSYKLLLVGNTFFNTTGTTLTMESYAMTFNDIYAESPIKYYDYDDESTFAPGDNTCGYLGYSGKQFYKIYGRYVYANGVSLTSDLRLKENIRSLDDPLEKIMNVRGVQYDFVSHSNPDWKESKNNEIENMDKNKIGFIAQELLEVIPELVKYDEKNDEYSVDYFGVIPILVEAMKEQQTEIEELRSTVELLSSNGGLKEASNITTSSEDFDISTLKSSLFQNSPNPFTEETTIKYYLSDEVSSASIFIYDMTGKQLRSYELHHDNKGNITINGGELDAGMYMYTLITDGQVIGSKQMVLTE